MKTNIKYTHYHIQRLNNASLSGLSSLCFSRFPDKVGSGRRLLKNPSFRRTSVSKINNNKPATTATMIIQIGTGSTSC